MRLYLNFPFQLMFYICFLDLGFKQNFQGNDKFRTFFSCKVHIAKFSLSKGSPYIKVCKSPLFPVKKNKTLCQKLNGCIGRTPRFQEKLTETQECCDFIYDDSSGLKSRTL